MAVYCWPSFAVQSTVAAVAAEFAAAPVVVAAAVEPSSCVGERQLPSEVLADGSFH